MSQADRLDRERERFDRSASVGRHGPARDSARHSPPRPRKRKAAEDHEEAPSDAAAEGSKGERKQKGSVFSRISFPDPGEGASKKRKSSSSELAPRNGLKEPAGRKVGSEAHREEPKGGKSSSVSARRGSGGHDRESSEEEYHFKRRPSSSSTRRDPAADREEEVTRTSRRSREREREREPHERGGRERERGHERPASKRR
ncbi:hypothetical protein B296_00003987 [Ensete ventricosum]|uniref:Uncharacterized protein n=1 Tax=Ensete ventricosum TaxID=4639 RepID=A0A427B303_ENSVE|nr:hypothetical protein B296_00003987 [Ensete ventricosum]